jgi:undecaprenyl-diphosphatase
MNFNVRLFKRINALVGSSKWLDAFGRAGAEYVVIGMLVWFVLADLSAYLPSKRAAILPILFLGTAWTLGWFLDLFIGIIVREPRPHITHPESKLLFTPLMNWKSFPSDHAMSSWLIFFIAAVFHLPFAWGLLPLALWVCWGRVYSGVHYPFDIVGGFGVAGLVSVVAYYVLVILV